MSARGGMEAIAKIKSKLSSYPEVRYVETRTSIEVLPVDESGFAVSLHIAKGGYTVHFDGWHEDFGAEGEALNCFAFGLSEACRLRVVYRGSTPTKWILEHRKGDSWVTDSEVGRILSPFWRPRRLVYLQNRLIPEFD